MKILLIKPSCTVYKLDPTLPSATLPFGLAYLASFLISKGEEVLVVDALSEGINYIEKDENKIRIGLPDIEIIKIIRNFHPEVVGITSMFTAYARDSHNLASLVKKIDPAIKVVLGGAHASIFPELSIKDQNIDIVVKGEGEITMWEIVQAIKESGNGLNIPGTIVRNNGRIICNTPREYIKNLDILPFPAYHLLPMEKYFQVSKDSPYLMYPRMCGLISSRGCPGDCCYCSIHSVWGHSWRGRSPGNVVDEIEFLMKNYGAKEFSFLDDSVACDKERMRGICVEIIERNIKIKWSTPNGISHWTLDEGLLDKMKEAGCYRLTFGIESANNKTREFIGWKENFSLNQAKHIIRYANKNGFWTICTFILGFPLEDEASIKDTIRFAIESDTDFAAFFLLMPFPGTKVYEVFRENGLLNFDDLLDPSIGGRELWFAKLGAALAQDGCDTNYFTKEELQEFLTKAYAKFWQARFISFLNPLRILRKINSMEDLTYAVRIILVGFRLKINQLKHRKFTAHMISRVNKDELREGISNLKRFSHRCP